MPSRAAEVPFREYSRGFTVLADVLDREKTYGPVQRGGRTHWRNYRRPIRGGISVFEMIHKIQVERLETLWSSVRPSLRA